MATLLTTPVTANGEYYLDLLNTGDAFMDVFGDFGSGTLVCSIGDLVADGGRTIPEFASLTADVDEPKKVFLPKGRIYFKLTGATSPSISIHCKAGGRQ